MRHYSLTEVQTNLIEKAAQSGGLIYASELRQDTANRLLEMGLITFSNQRRKPYVTDYLLTVQGYEAAHERGLPVPTVSQEEFTKLRASSLLAYMTPYGTILFERIIRMPEESALVAIFPSFEDHVYREAKSWLMTAIESGVPPGQFKGHEDWIHYRFAPNQFMELQDEDATEKPYSPQMGEKLHGIKKQHHELRQAVWAALKLAGEAKGKCPDDDRMIIRSVELMAKGLRACRGILAANEKVQNTSISHGDYVPNAAIFYAEVTYPPTVLRLLQEVLQEGGVQYEFIDANEMARLRLVPADDNGAICQGMKVEGAAVVSYVRKLVKNYSGINELWLD